MVLDDRVLPREGLVMDRAALDLLVDRSIDRAALARDCISRSTAHVRTSAVTIADAMHRHERLRARHAWCPTIYGGAPDIDDGGAASVQPERGPLSGVRVLVVDNNPNVREMFETVFDCSGASVVAAETGRSAFRMFQAASPHVVVTDVAMPDWTGERLLREIRALPPDRGGATPVIAITGAYTEAEDVRRAKEAGFNAWVTKPISVSAVVKLVADVATARRQSVSSRDAGG